MFDLNYTKLYKDILGKPINTDGTFGDIYKCGDIVVKKFKEQYYGEKIIDIDVFNALKEIDNRCFIDLIDCNVKTKNISTIYLSNNRKITKEEKIITAYSYKYIEKSKVKAVDRPLDYTLESLLEMKKLLKDLNEKGIIIHDAHGDNCITSDREIVIIDPDQYRFGDKAEIINLGLIKEYISDLWKKEIFDTKKNKDYTELAYRLFLGKDMDNLIDDLKYEIGNNTPREYITKVLKKN